MIKWPADLVNAVARRRVVLFLGAGVSMNSVDENGQHPPSWKQFLKDAIAACDPPRREMQRHLKDGDFLTCCQLIKYKMGSQWVSYLEEKFFEPKFSPHKIHELLFDLDANIVLTPNFDTIYDKYAVAKTEQNLKIKKYYDEDVVRSLRGNEKQRLILKIHGSIDMADKLVFTREDYAAVRQQYGSFYRAIEALIITHTFVFIGCGMNDPDLSLLLEQYAYSFASAPPHYFVSAKSVSTDFKQMLEKNYNLHLIKYSDKDSHAELLQSLEDLGTVVDTKRTALAESGLW